MSECLSFSRILEYSRGETKVTPAEVDHLRRCPKCEERLKLAGDDTELERQLREVEQQADPFYMTASATIGDFDLVREIGRGGQGMVYEAVQKSLNRSVALKILPALLHSLHPESGQRFKAEAAAAARLQHPNIVSVYDYGEQQGCHYYAMQLIRGRSLSEVIKDRSPDPSDLRQLESAAQGTADEKDYFRQVAQWIAEVADGLQFAHDQGVIHRDIKPSNLILCETGRVMISDFGLAKDTTAEAVTRSGQVMGTWRYMSPEQVGDRGAIVDHRTDVYSLGVTLYELLTLQPALPGGRDHEMLRRVLEHEPAPPRKVNPQIPADLEIICGKAMTKQAAMRYQTAADMACDLRRFLNDEPIRARRPEIHARVMRFVRRHRPTVALALVALLLATSVISTAAYLDAARERAELLSAVTAERVTFARQLLDDERYHMAASVYSRALEQDPNLAYAYAARALAYSEVGQSDSAISDLNSAIALSPQRFGPYLRRGVLRLCQNAARLAFADFEAALTRRPYDDQARVFRFLARQRMADGSTTEGVQLLLAGPQGPMGSDYLRLLADHLVSGGDLAAVVEAASAPPARALVYCAAAEQALLTGDSQRAEELYNKSIEADNTPNIVRLYCRRRLEELTDP